MPTAAPRSAKPTKEIFDPFNSSATGHQRAENRLSGSTSWRDSRTLKLKNQFNGSDKRVSDSVGAGSLHFGKDGRTATGGWEKGAQGLRTGGQKGIWETMGVEKDVERSVKRVKKEESGTQPTTTVNPYTPFRKTDGSIRETSWTSHESSPSHLLSPIDPIAAADEPADAPTGEQDQETTEDSDFPPQVFANLNIYVNGSTAPAISDHKLKYILTSHGAGISIALGRRTVTHVIIGRPVSASGSGGGLAMSKLQKEIAKTRRNGVKYVTVEWVLESVKAGKRQPESKFAALSVAPKGVMSAVRMFERHNSAVKGSGTENEGG